MSKAESHVEALSPECEEYLCKKGMYSIADHKDETDPADVYTTDGYVVVMQVPRDIEAYYLMRLVEHGQEQYAKGLAAAKAAIAAL